jgi:hypothetical protein
MKGDRNAAMLEAMRRKAESMRERAKGVRDRMEEFSGQLARAAEAIRTLRDAQGQKAPAKWWELETDGKVH